MHWGAGRGGLWQQLLHGCQLCHAPAFRAPLQLGRRDLDLGPKGNTQVDLSTYTSGHGADIGRRLRGPRGQFCTFSESGTSKALSPRGAFHLGGPAIYGNSWGRTPQAHGNVRPEAQDVFFPESSWVGAWAGQGLTAKAGHWPIAWLEGRQAWALLGGARARARGHFPRLFLEGYEDAH